MVAKTAVRWTRKEWSEIETNSEAPVAQDDFTPEELVRAIEQSLKDFKR